MKIFYHDLPLSKEEPVDPVVDAAAAPVADAPQEDPPEVPWEAKEHPVFMPKTDMYMISGDNPNYKLDGTPLTDEEKKNGVFQTSNDELLKSFEQRKQTDDKMKNATFEVGEGRYNGIDENSILVTNAPIDVVMELAKKHGQESFVHLPPYPAATKMVYANGPHAGEHEHGVRSGTQTFMEAPSNYFTKLPSMGGKYLRLAFNWNNFHRDNDCPQDTGVFTPKEKETAMKSENTIADLKKAIAELLKKEIKQHEDFLVDLRKSSPPGHEKQVGAIADKMQGEGKSKEEAKESAVKIAWAQHGQHGEHKKSACEKCGMKMESPSCKKCDMSDVKKSEVEELATFLAVADKLVKAAKESGSEDSAPLSLADKKMGGKGPKEIPESSEVSAPGSGDDKKAGKPEKAPALTKGVQNIKAEGSEESSKSKEESSKSKEESSPVSKSLDLVTDLIKAFDHKAPMPVAAHAAPSLTAPAHAPVAKIPQPVLHSHPAGAAIPSAVAHSNPMQGKLEALKHQAASMKKPKIPSVK
jgi:hypothetical protein